VHATRGRRTGPQIIGPTLPFAVAMERGSFAAMTVEELKAEAAKLPPDDRFALAEWIEQSEDIRDLRRGALIREIRIGLDELDRGECGECKDEMELREFFDGVKARGRESLTAQKESAV
jgi:hypothetical protein